MQNAECRMRTATSKSSQSLLIARGEPTHCGRREADRQHVGESYRASVRTPALIRARPTTPDMGTDRAPGVECSAIVKRHGQTSHKLSYTKPARLAETLRIPNPRQARPAHPWCHRYSMLC